jgi:glycosyltransferase involved in cell wall biosynthesis
MSGPDVVFAFFRATWTVSSERGGFYAQDRLARAILAPDAPFGRVLVAEAARFAPRVWLDRIQGRRTPFDGGPRARLVSPLRVTRDDPSDPRLAELSYRRYSASLARAVRRHGLRRPTVITTNPLLAGLGRFGWAANVVHYATDDFTASPHHQRWRRPLTLAYRRLAERGVAVCAVSPVILDRIGPTRHARVVPNGVEAAEWARPGGAPEWFGALQAPRFLYVGALDRRIDLDAVAQLARELPHARTVFVGLTLDRDHVARLSRIPGVTVAPHVQRQQLVGLLAAADACLLPHVRSPMTEAMSPLKIYEYLAAGRPVVATDLPPVRAIDPRVLLVPPGGDFAAAARRALELGPASEDARMEFVRRNAWPRRHAEIFALAAGTRA